VCGLSFPSLGQLAPSAVHWLVPLVGTFCPSSLRVMAAPFQQSTQERWASRTHGEPGFRVTLGLTKTY
jgi:hypothetical protein